LKLRTFRDAFRKSGLKLYNQPGTNNLRCKIKGIKGITTLCPLEGLHYKRTGNIVPFDAAAINLGIDARTVDIIIEAADTDMVQDKGTPEYRLRTFFKSFVR
jgi:hypothetical protein